jgi:deoxyribose-phosphate aldolase
MESVKTIAKMIDHSLLHPTMTDQEMRDGCAIALKYDVASVCIKPYAVKLAAGILKGSDVKVGTVIGFPHGSSSIEIKIAETLQAIRDGAEEVDMVVNIGKVLQEDWDYVSEEIRAITETCHSHGVIIKVIFENDFLPEDRFKIRLCKICTECSVDFVKTSTGYGFLKVQDGHYSYVGATEHDIKLMCKHIGPNVQVKAAGGIRTLEGILNARNSGATRCGATATITILEEAKMKFQGSDKGPASNDTKTSSEKGY